MYTITRTRKRAEGIRVKVCVNTQVFKYQKEQGKGRWDSKRAEIASFPGVAILAYEDLLGTRRWVHITSYRLNT